MADGKFEAQGNVWGTRGTFESVQPLVIGTAYVEVLARLKGDDETILVGTVDAPVLAREPIQVQDTEDGLTLVPTEIDSELVAERIRAIIEGRPDRPTPAPADDIDMREKALDLAVFHGHKDDDDARIVARADAFYQFLVQR